MKVYKIQLLVKKLWDSGNKNKGDNEKRGISGGEKKRVNIGIELVSGILTVNMCLINKEPRVLFLDEPTTGLDSSVSKDLMIHLKEIARSTGLTVIAVLHQPRYDIFSEVDDIVLLGRGGRTIFSGPTSNCYDYFSSIGYTCPEQMNPAGEIKNIVFLCFYIKKIFIWMSQAELLQMK